MDDDELRVMSDSLDRNGYQKYCSWRSHDEDAADQVVADYETILEDAKDEKPLQDFLALHPELLVSEESGMCRWVIPQKSLGGKFRPDFLVARLDSIGVKWMLVELQSPRTKLFTRTDEPAEQLREGIGQILRWRRWLENNRDMARRPQSEDGLGLTGISHSSRGLVLIGRAGDRNAVNRPHIEQLSWDNQIGIHSYDWLTRQAHKRTEARNEFGRGYCDECLPSQGL